MHITHKWADINKLELFSTPEADSLLKRLNALEWVNGCVILKTCNRVEVYLSTNNTYAAETELKNYLIPSGGELADFVRIIDGRDSVKHLMKVASGIDSMIIGEDQILGQIKEAYDFALEEGTVCNKLGNVFRKVINVGKKVRTETSINNGMVSIGSAAVDLAVKLLVDLSDKTVLVIGAGETGTLVAKALAKRNLKAIFVANRTFDTAQKLAQQLGGEAIDYSKMPEYILKTDVIISATAAPHIIITKKEMESMLKERKIDHKLLVIDIANPRDIEEDVKSIPMVDLFNIDSLKSKCESALTKRKEEIEKVENIINNELELFTLTCQKKNADEILKILYKDTNNIIDVEYEKMLKKIKLDDREKKVISNLLNSISKKILANPTFTIQEASKNDNEELLKNAIKLFKIKYKSDVCDNPQEA